MTNTALKLPDSNQSNFRDFLLSEAVVKALEAIGYENPTPIQSEIIPHILAGKDVLGQAQTGTGKTAAFALPLLTNLNLSLKAPQVLVLAPTRELAIQVAEAFQTYASRIDGFQVLPIYGGQDMSLQLRQLKRGPQVVVGTPGRVMDHMRRGTLKLEKLQTLVLDEADEMLRMGFIEDVEWILEQTPDQRQVALFSATMPTAVRRIAKKYLKNPEEITIKVTSTTAETIRQRYWIVSGAHKLDALTRILEAESFDAIIIFVRTKLETIELAEKLNARGFAASALNGDIAQNQRERTIDQLKKGKLDILIATDVAARGLDVERISHVINYSIPHDTESYVHRIGRTGRAGRAGEAILFVAPREQRMLRTIEQATNKKIELMQLPTTQIINEKRIALFKQRISDTLTSNNISLFRELISQYQQENEVELLDIAAALAKLYQGDEPLLLKDKPNVYKAAESFDRDRGGDKRSDRRDNRESREWSPERPSREKRSKRSDGVAEGMIRYRIEVGKQHDVRPGNIVGAIANEGNIDGRDIGDIQIFDSFSTVDLPKSTSPKVIHTLKKVWVAGQPLNIAPMEGSASPSREKDSRDKSRNPKQRRGDEYVNPAKRGHSGKTKPKTKDRSKRSFSK